ncbi:hypothetical protein BDP27DRAFT_1422319 [Rhodocollybia butyracea]|uniref:Uncharacterized protein n=1 Tax=Rhodocollybia butyracea TaxID=206335 RepID=A0A9P5U6S3_9AGAR|nr:hypothetical protein BDP27DRAFT_1422319 [Rhodocollybia butyracea]
MSSLRSMNRRRRSQSAATSSNSTLHRDSSWRGATKRAFPANTGNGDLSSIKRDVETWRPKRRRRDGSPSGTSSDDDAAPNYTPRSINKPFAFPSSSTEFGFSREPRQRHSVYTSVRNEESPSPYELAQIRSNAFWELRRSVAESGEGFVRRMRDYEQSRARSDAFNKVKDAQKRGLKRSSLLSRKAPFTSRPDSESENDDIQIFSGHLSDAFLSRNACSVNTGSRSPSSPSIDYMDEDPVQRDRYPSSSSLTATSGPLLADSTQSAFAVAAQPLDITFSSSHSTNSSVLSSPIPSPSFTLPLTSEYPSSRSEKAIAALSLAMANGAGSITEDYEAFALYNLY